MASLGATLAGLRTRAKIDAFIKVAMTEKEIRQINIRWSAIRLVAAGEPQRSVQSKLSREFKRTTKGKPVKVGIATVSRASQTIKQHKPLISVLLGKAATQT